MSILSQSLRLVALGASLTMVAGCAARGGDDADGSEGAMVVQVRIQPGSFKLYDRPQYESPPSCDLHTALTLGNDADGAFAELRDTLSGSCEIYVQPNERTYHLARTGEECGSQIYEGTTSVDGKERDIVLVDHRTRLCHDMVPARIVVEETLAAAAQKVGQPKQTFVKFSADVMLEAP
jgi:hypothetical protein